MTERMRYEGSALAGSDFNPSAPGYTAIVGCYGGRRGTALGQLVKRRVYEIAPELADRVQILGRGNQKFIGNKVNKPLDPQHLEALALSSGDSYVQRSVEDLAQIGRRAAKPEEIRAAHAVYTVDAFVLAEYAKQAGEQVGSGKYRTVLQGAGENHARYGADMDDTETSTQFTASYIVPNIKRKKAGEPEVPIPPGAKENADYFALDGTKYRAGSVEAIAHEAQDLVRVAGKLAERIVGDAAAYHRLGGENGSR